MSTDAAELRGSGVPAGWRDLEQSIERLLTEHDGVRTRLDEAEARIRELEEALQGVSSGELDPSEMASELRDLRRENEELAARMADAREAVRRILGRLRFVEEDR